MKQYFILACLLLTCISGYSQTKETALRDAKVTAKATMDADYKTVVKHTYPTIIALMGGTESAVKVIEQTFEAMKTQGIVFQSATVESVSDIVKEQDQYRCYVQGTNVITMPGQKITSKSYLLGIYDSTKKIWYFLEAEKLKNSTLVNQILPNFKTDLNIPEDDVNITPN